MDGRKRQLLGKSVSFRRLLDFGPQRNLSKLGPLDSGDKERAKMGLVDTGKCPRCLSMNNKDYLLSSTSELSIGTQGNACSIGFPFPNNIHYTVTTKSHL